MKRIFTLGKIALLSTLFLGACDVERTYYFLEGITLHEIPDFAQDANEGGSQANPDIFVQIVDFDGFIVWSSPYYSNVDIGEFPIHFTMDNVLELGHQDYFLEVYDFDDLNQGNHDFLGSIEFYGRDVTSTYYSQYNNPSISGNLSVTIDMLVERE